MNHSILPKPVSLRKDLIFYFKMTDAGEGVPHLCPNSMAREVNYKCVALFAILPKLFPEQNPACLH